jgi:hypothetical protein
LYRLRIVKQQQNALESRMDTSAATTNDLPQPTAMVAEDEARILQITEQDLL